MKSLKEVFILLILIGVFSCKKTAIATNPNYEGRWLESDHCSHEITFENNGQASYMNRTRETDCDRDRASGKAKIKEHTIIIGRHRFFIDTPPTQIDTLVIPNYYYPHDPPPIPEKTIMKMILNGNTFYKVLE
ncbi:hypothetical protein BH10BAC1_BH10BAC1_18860 [soil metagenome]